MASDPRPSSDLSPTRDRICTIPPPNCDLNSGTLNDPVGPAALNHGLGSVNGMWSAEARQALVSVVENDCTAIFGPKDYQSSGPRALEALIATAPRPRRIIVVIVPPLCPDTEQQLGALARGAGLEVHTAAPYANVYEVCSVLDAALILLQCPGHVALW